MIFYSVVLSLFCATFVMSNDQSLQKVELEKLCFEDYCTIKAIKKLNPKENLSILDKYFSMILYKKTEKIGEITYDAPSHDSKKIGLINYLYIDEKYRRTGIGTLLFKEALQDCKEKGCGKVFWCSSSMGVPFYLKNGAVQRKTNKSFCTYPMKMHLRERTFEEKFSKFVKHYGQHFHKNDLFE